MTSATVPVYQPQNQISRTSAGAIWSFVLSLLSFLCFGPLTGIPAIICGHVAHSNIKRSQGTLTGDGLAIAGLVIGYLVSIGWIFIFVLFGLGTLGALIGTGASL